MFHYVYSPMLSLIHNASHKIFGTQESHVLKAWWSGFIKVHFNFNQIDVHWYQWCILGINDVLKYIRSIWCLCISLAQTSTMSQMELRVVVITLIYTSSIFCMYFASQGCVHSHYFPITTVHWLTNPFYNYYQLLCHFCDSCYIKGAQYQVT